MPDFRIDVQVDPSGAIAGVRRTGRALDGLGQRADRLRGLLTRAFAGLGAAVGGADIIRRIAGFSQAMSTVRAVTGATERQFQSLRRRAQELGSTTRFSASEAAAGMEFLARAGFETDEVLQSIEGTLQLAQAGALELGAAADIASNVISGFGLSAQQTARIVDVLAFAAANSNTNVQQLGDAMSFTAPIAAGLGVSVEEAAAAIGALSDAGLQGSRAGTGLNRVLAELESPTEATVKIFRALGVEAADVQVSQVGLATALERLRDAGIDTGLALEAFGQRGGPAFNVLVNNIPRVREMTGELEDAEGTARRLATTMDDNLNGALLSVASAWEGVILAFGDLGTENVLTRGFNALADALRLVARNLDDVARYAVAIASVLAVRRIAAIARIFGRPGLAGAVLAVVGGMRLLRLALRALGIGLVIEGIVLLIDQFQRLERFVANTPHTWGDAALIAGDRFANGLVNALVALGGAIPNVIRLITDPIAETFAGLGRELPGLIFGDTTFREMDARIEAGVRGAIANAFSRLGDTFMADLSARHLRIAPDALIESFETFGRVDGITHQFGELGSQAPGALNKTGDAAIEAAAVIEDLAETTTVSAEAADAQAEAFARLRDGLFPLTAAAEQLAAEEQVLDRALAAGTITGQQHATMIGSLRDSYRDTLDPLGALYRELQREMGLNTTRIDQREVEIELERRLAELRRDGLILRAEDTASLRQSIANRQADARQRARELQIYRQLRSPVMEYREQLQALQSVLALHPELAGEAAQAEEDLRLAFLDSQTNLSAGIERGFIRATRAAGDFASDAERFISDGFRRAGDAITQALLTGEDSFRAFRNEIVRQLTSIAVQRFLVDPVVNATASLLGFQSQAQATAAATSISFDGVKSAVSSAIGTISDLFSTASSGIADLVTSGLSTLTALIASAGRGLRGFFSSVVDAIGSFFGSGGGSGLVDTVVSIGRKIASFFGFADGGLIRGPGSGTSDSIATMLPVGGFVVNAASTRRFRPMLDAMAEGRFAAGGLVPARVSNGEYILGPETAARYGPMLDRMNAARYQDGGAVTAQPAQDDRLGIFALLYAALIGASSTISRGLRLAGDEIRDGGEQTAIRTRDTLAGIFDGLDAEVRSGLSGLEEDLRNSADEAMLGAAARSAIAILTGNPISAFYHVVSEAAEQRDIARNALGEAVMFGGAIYAEATQSLTEAARTFGLGFQDAISMVSLDVVESARAFESASQAFAEAVGGAAMDVATSAQEAGRAIDNAYGGYAPSPERGRGGDGGGGGGGRSPGASIDASDRGSGPFAAGGFVGARVSNGEYILGPRTAGRYGSLLSAINGYQNGGYVGGGAVVSVEIVDERTAPAALPEVEVDDDVVRVRLRDTVDDGALDEPLARRFGLVPLTY